MARAKACTQPRCKKLAWSQLAVDGKWYWWCAVHKAIGKVEEK